jgi:hypothetical protein
VAGGVSGEETVVEKLNNVACSLLSWSVDVLEDLEKCVNKLKKGVRKLQKASYG